VGAARVAGAVWLLALPVTALIIWLDFDLSPAAARMEAALRSEALRAGILAPLEPGRFRSLAGGRIVVYARGALPNGDLNDVFVKRSEGPLIETTVARRAHYTVSSDGESETITLYDGERIAGQPGSERYRLMRFDQQLVPIRTPETAAGSPRVDGMSTAALLGSRDPKLLAELQWRLGVPIMTLVLTALAIPLGRLRPRQGRYAHVWLAIVVFASYAMLALASRTWIERGRLSPRLGLWWVHGLFIAACAVAMISPSLVRARNARRVGT
jgi:lipopolysaccharide export system permease protein